MPSTLARNHYVRATPTTFDIEPLTPETARSWLDGFSATGRYQLFPAIDRQALLGYACSHEFRAKHAYEPSVETTVYCDPESTGKGLGSRLYGALFAALEGEDIHRAYAGITLPNPASVILHEAFGFRYIGTYSEVGRKLGRYWDVAWYEKRL
jgi:phosphinothricin acetyltransferase